MIDSGTLVLIISALIGTGGLSAFLKIWIDRRSGREDARVREVERINALYEAERARADAAERRLRKLREHVTDVRIWAKTRCNASDDDFPEYPSL